MNVIIKEMDSMNYPKKIDSWKLVRETDNGFRYIFDNKNLLKNMRYHRRFTGDLIEVKLITIESWYPMGPGSLTLNAYVNNNNTEELMNVNISGGIEKAFNTAKKYMKEKEEYLKRKKHR